MSIVDCLISSVGLSETECDCFEDDRPSEAHLSDSGLYIDDPMYSIPLKFIPEDCGENSIWAVLEKARIDGVKSFLLDYGSAIKKRYRHKFTKYQNYIGRKDYNYNLSSKTHAGWFIQPKIWKGVKLSIYQVEIYLSGSQTVDLEIYKNEDFSEVIATIPVVVSSDKGKNILQKPIELPLADENGLPINYYFVYDTNGQSAKNNTLSCGSCGDKRPWENYILVQGTAAELLNDLPDSSRNFNAYGLRMNVQVSCSEKWLCRNWDYDQSFPFVMAQAIKLLSIRSLLVRVMGRPSPYTAVNVEYIQNRLNLVNELLVERMTWLVDNMPLEDQDCYTCDRRITVGELLI